MNPRHALRERASDVLWIGSLNHRLECRPPVLTRFPYFSYLPAKLCQVNSRCLTNRFVPELTRSVGSVDRARGGPLVCGGPRRGHGREIAPPSEAGAEPRGGSWRRVSALWPGSAVPP